MWVFTRGGFFSVVQYDPKQDKEKQSPFKKIAKNKFTHVLVRARVKEDLEALRSVVPNVKVVDDVIADYKFRAVISRRQWKKYLNLAVDDINYDSHFKEVMRDADKLQGTARYSAAMKVWSAMIELQPMGAWATTYTSSSKSSYKNWNIDDWFEKRDAEERALAAEEVDAVVVQDESVPLDLYDVKSYILTATDEYPNFLTESEIARTTEAGFELWARVLEDQKKLGKANLNVDDEYVEGLVAEIERKHSDLAPEDRSVEFQDVPEEEAAQEKLT